MIKNAGFTLIETLVAIAIMTIAISVPYYSVSKALVASYTARDQLTASALAQEGLEYVRGVRDSNYISNYQTGGTLNWLANLDGTTGVSGYTKLNCFTQSCVVDVYYRYGKACDASDPYCLLLPLNMHSNNALFTQRTNTGYKPSRFARAVRLTQISGSEVLATVTVSWITNGAPYKVVVKEYMENWLP